MKKNEYPDWTAQTYLMILRNKENGKSLWKDYDRKEEDLLVLRVTVEIIKSSLQLKAGRQEAWDTAKVIAAQMHKIEPTKTYVVTYRPESQNVGREAICVYQFLNAFSE